MFKINKFSYVVPILMLGYLTAADAAPARCVKVTLKNTGLSALHYKFFNSCQFKNHRSSVAGILGSGQKVKVKIVRGSGFTVHAVAPDAVAPRHHAKFNAQKRMFILSGGGSTLCHGGCCWPPCASYSIK